VVNATPVKHADYRRGMAITTSTDGLRKRVPSVNKSG
jgi:hypothetical protein